MRPFYSEWTFHVLLYLRNALAEYPADKVVEAIDHGAVQRVRPKAMTVAVILGGLAPIMWSEGTGAEVMQRIAAPLLSMLVIPAAFT